MREVYFGNKGSHKDWGLILSKKVIGLPPVKTHYVDLPEGDGSLDLSESLRGEVAFDMRELRFEFTVTQPVIEWESLERSINNFLHGSRLEIREPDDQDYYYVGRCEVDSFDRKENYAILTIVVTCEPYKLKNDLTKVRAVIGAAGSLSLVLKNERKRVLPTIKNSAEVTIKFGDSSRVVSAGTHRFTNIILAPGDNPITLSGANGTSIDIHYQEGAV